MCTEYTINEYTKVLGYISAAKIDYENITNMSEYINSIRAIVKKDGTKLSELSVKMYLVATLWYLKKNNKNVDGQILIKKEIELIAKNHDVMVKSHILIGSQIDNYMSWSEILEFYNTLVYPKSKTKVVTYVLFSCYILLPPRRLKDYSLMHIVCKDKDESKNYYDSVSHEFIFSNYKSKKYYRTQRVKVPELLYNLLDRYISEYKIVDSLFGLSTKGINMRLSRLFQSNCGKTISVNILRHSYISFLRDSGKLNGKEHIYAKLMAHSIATQLDYYKDPANEEIDEYYTDDDILVLP